jgi:hypothetical protein
MTELSPEAVAAGEAAAIAVTGVERTEELQEAVVNAEIDASIAAGEAANATETAEVAAETAVVGIAVAADAGNTAEEASQKADEAKSEIAQLRDETRQGFAEVSDSINRVLTALTPPEPETTGVEEVTTDDSGNAGSGDSVGKSDAESGKSRSGATGETPRPRGFHGKHRR